MTTSAETSPRGGSMTSLVLPGLLFEPIPHAPVVHYGFFLVGTDKGVSFRTTNRLVDDGEVIACLTMMRDRILGRVLLDWGDEDRARVGGRVLPGLGWEDSLGSRRPAEEVFGSLVCDPLPEGDVVEWALVLVRSASGSWYWRKAGAGVTDEELTGWLQLHIDRLRSRVAEG